MKETRFSDAIAIAVLAVLVLLHGWKMLETWRTAGLAHAEGIYSINESSPTNDSLGFEDMHRVVRGILKAQGNLLDEYRPALYILKRELHISLALPGAAQLQTVFAEIGSALNTEARDITASRMQPVAAPPLPEKCQRCEDCVTVAAPAPMPDLLVYSRLELHDKPRLLPLDAITLGALAAALFLCIRSARRRRQ